MRHKRYLTKKCKSLEGKTVIVTGATGGIGREICVCCLMLGADVVMAVRNVKKGATVRESILKRVGGDITISELDVADFASIDKFVENFSAPKECYLINNAGVLSERQYETNFLGTMYLSKKLEPLMKKVIFQTSISYRWRSARKDCSKVRRNMIKYAWSKRLLTQSVVALDNPKYCLVHPGVCCTNIFPIAIGRVLARPFLHGTRTAALPAVIALTKDVPSTHILAPRGFGVWGKPKLRKIHKGIYKCKN